MSACGSVARLVDKTAKLPAVLEVKEAVAATLGKNVSIIPQEEIDLVIKRGAEKEAFDTVAACGRTRQQRREEAATETQTRRRQWPPHLASLGLMSWPRCVPCCALGSASRLRTSYLPARPPRPQIKPRPASSRPVLDSLRETLGKPDATVADIKVELEARPPRAVEAKKACGDVSTDTETRRCRSTRM